jgi:inhibitor of the pro-sigma K processing machinery
MKTFSFPERPAGPELLILKEELLGPGGLANAYRQFDQAWTGTGGVVHLSDQRRESPVQLSHPRHQGAQPHGRRGGAGGGGRMDLNQKIIAAILAGFFLIALIRVFSAPLRLALKLLANTALGFLALWAVGLTSGVTGITLGLNLWNALVIGILGLPGFALLLLVQWVL